MRGSAIVAIVLACAPLAACGPQGVGLDADSREPQIVMDIAGTQVHGTLIEGMHTDLSGKEYTLAEFEYQCRDGGDASADADVALDRLRVRLEAQSVQWFTVNCTLPGAEGGRWLTDYVRDGEDWSRKEATRKSAM